MLAEPRIEQAVRSSNWVWATYQNMASNAVFDTFGAAGQVAFGYPQISSIGVQNLSNTSADVVGRLITNGASTAVVTLYWNTTNGMTNTTTWTTGADAGSSTFSGLLDGATFTNTLTPLTPNTTYYWNYSAVNASGTVWGATTGFPFKTYGPPGVNNGAGATGISQVGVMVNGNLTNGVAAHVYILGGFQDGNWLLTNDVGTIGEGSFSNTIGGLTPGTTYYYTSYATNAYGGTQATPSVCFTTLQGSAYYWVGASNAPWSVGSSWSTSSGGASGSVVPSVGDNVVFDGCGVSNALVDAAFGGSVGSVTINPGYSGTITQSNNLTIVNNFTMNTGVWQFVTGRPGALTVGNNMTISNATIYCQRISTGGNGTGRVFQIGGSLTVATNGILTADGLGFGPVGSPGYWAGGSHGGQGGSSLLWGYIPAMPYGVITAPTSMGGGGWGVAGGGAIALFVTNDVILQAGGRITAAGISTNSGGYSAGAGGSVYLRCRTLSGAGTIAADGGNDVGSQTAGGGGRIAVILSAGTDLGQVVCHAYGGYDNNVPAYHGAAGTVYIQTSGQANGAGTLVLDNANRQASYPKTMLRSGEDWSGFAAVIVTNQADVGIYTNVDISAVKFVFCGTTSSFITVRSPGLGLVFPNNWVISNFTLAVDTPVTLPGNITVAPSGAIIHSANEATYKAFSIDLTATNLLVQGVISADSKGFAAGDPGNGPAPARYQHGAAYGGDRGVYYNDGNAVGGTPYGSITNPTDLGSGGYTLAGGGAIKLTVPGTLTLGGTAAKISACSSYSYGGSGSGGSIWITAGALASNGIVQADGGSSGLGGGSGGRISVWSTSGNFDSVTFHAYGGPVSGTNWGGAAGTVYLRGTQTYGQLITDNTNYNATGSTLITSNVTGTAVGDVIMRRKGSLALGTNATLTVCGSWTNDSTCSFTALTNSTVVFGSTNTATIYGTNVFFNLTATNSGKVLTFQAAKTNTIKGQITLAGVTLNSTVPGQYTYLTLATGGVQLLGAVAVQDNNAGGGQTLSAADGSLNNGHNVNWVFGGPGTVFAVR